MSGNNMGPSDSYDSNQSTGYESMSDPFFFDYSSSQEMGPPPLPNRFQPPQQQQSQMPPQSQHMQQTMEHHHSQMGDNHHWQSQQQPQYQNNRHQQMPQQHYQQQQQYQPPSQQLHQVQQPKQPQQQQTPQQQPPQQQTIQQIPQQQTPQQPPQQPPQQQTPQQQTPQQQPPQQQTQPQQPSQQEQTPQPLSQQSQESLFPPSAPPSAPSAAPSTPQFRIQSQTPTPAPQKAPPSSSATPQFVINKSSPSSRSSTPVHVDKTKINVLRQQVLHPVDPKVAERMHKAPAPKPRDNVAEMLMRMKDYESVIPDSTAKYMMTRTGAAADDDICYRMLAISGQKFASDILSDAITIARSRGLGQTNRATKETKYVLTQELLKEVFSEHGIRTFNS